MILIKICEITIDPGRRAPLPKHIRQLADSIAEVGLLQPIVVDKHFALIAGLHRLEAAKLLAWTEIECTVSDLEGLEAELAEIDENVIRNNLDDIDLGKKLIRRKEVYEALHPASKQGGDRRSEDFKTSPARFDSAKAFTIDTSEKTGLSRRTVEQKMQIARDLTPEVQEVVKRNHVGFKNALKLSRLAPEQQIEAAALLADGKIRKVDEYTMAQGKSTSALPFQMTQRTFSSFEEGVADLKNTEKDCSCTPGDFLAEVTAFVLKFHKEIEWFNNPYYEAVFPDLNAEQLDYLRQQMEAVSTAAKKLYKSVERNAKK